MRFLTSDARAVYGILAGQGRYLYAYDAHLTAASSISGSKSETDV
ncbi:MAG TPA: hypothetical protein VEI01_12110 [Terriglobales bacterium]|nr:hypothetical protein [Terriglobales bacterium]